MNKILPHQTTSPPSAIKVTLLLAEFCPANVAGFEGAAVPAGVTVNSRRMLSQTGWHHDGINE